LENNDSESVSSDFRTRRRTRRRRGFTLLEVLLVLVILVLLAGTATIFYAKMQTNAQRDVARTQIQMFKDALRIYFLDMGSYPSEQQGLDALMQAPGDMSNPNKWRGPYLEKANFSDPWEMPYKYMILDANNVQIVSFGPDRTEGTQDDVAG
jgi:general secretion pathway protein G